MRERLLMGDTVNIVDFEKFKKETKVKNDDTIFNELMGEMIQMHENYAAGKFLLLRSIINCANHMKFINEISVETVIGLMISSYDKHVENKEFLINIDKPLDIVKYIKDFDEQINTIMENALLQFCKTHTIDMNKKGE